MLLKALILLSSWFSNRFPCCYWKLYVLLLIAMHRYLQTVFKREAQLRGDSKGLECSPKLGCN